MDNSKSSILYIQTVTGPKLLKDLNGKYVLPYEHISQNLTEFHYNHDKNKYNAFKNSKKINEMITLENLSENIKYKFSNLKNLVLENEENKMANELSSLKKYNCNLILDTTTRTNGIDYKFLKKVSTISGINVAFGFTLEKDICFNKDYEIKDKQAVLEKMKYIFLYGNDDKLVPSFIGEILLSENGPNIQERKYLNICFRMSRENSIPIFIKLPNYLTKIDFNFFIDSCQSFKNDCKRIVFIISKVQVNLFIALSE